MAIPTRDMSSPRTGNMPPAASIARGTKLNKGSGIIVSFKTGPKRTLQTRLGARMGRQPRLTQRRQQLHEVALCTRGLTDGLQFIGKLHMLVQLCSQVSDSPHDTKRLLITSFTRSSLGGNG